MRKYKVSFIHTSQKKQTHPVGNMPSRSAFSCASRWSLASSCCSACWLRRSAGSREGERTLPTPPRPAWTALGGGGWAERVERPLSSSSLSYADLVLELALRLPAPPRPVLTIGSLPRESDLSEKGMSVFVRERVGVE